MGDKYGQNIFELLSEDSSKKQKQQKKENVPKADNKAKKETKAPVKANNNNNNKAPQQPKGNGRGRGEGRGRGGRGRGPRREGNFPVEGENQQQRGNNNRGRQASRRQRDESFKRGDYGAPDAEGRQKRPYEKFSHSAGARRKQEKKGGAGAGNWGAKGQVPEEAPVAEEEKKEFEEAPVADEAIENVEGDEEVAPEEEEDEEIDYDTFVERQKKESEALSQLITTDIRKVDRAEYEDLKTVSKSDNVAQFVALSGKKKGKKAAKADNGKGVTVDQVLDVRAPPQDNRRKGRQNNRNQRSNQKRNVNLTLDDDKDFPSLGK